MIIIKRIEKITSEPLEKYPMPVYRAITADVVNICSYFNNSDNSAVIIVNSYAEKIEAKSMFSVDTTKAEIIENLVDNWIREVYVIDDDGEGIIIYYQKE